MYHKKGQFTVMGFFSLSDQEAYNKTVFMFEHNCFSKELIDECCEKCGAKNYTTVFITCLNSFGSHFRRERFINFLEENKKYKRSNIYFYFQISRHILGSNLHNELTDFVLRELSNFERSDSVFQIYEFPEIDIIDILFSRLYSGYNQKSDIKLFNINLFLFASILRYSSKSGSKEYDEIKNKISSSLVSLIHKNKSHNEEMLHKIKKALGGHKSYSHAYLFYREISEINDMPLYALKYIVSLDIRYVETEIKENMLEYLHKYIQKNINEILKDEKTIMTCLSSLLYLGVSSEGTLHPNWFYSNLVKTPKVIDIFESLINFFVDSELIKKNLIKNNFTECIFYYSKFFIKKRWPEAEPFLMERTVEYHKYLKRFAKSFDRKVVFENVRFL